ncbi:MAG: hypothetical protein RR212_14410 [Bacteroidales bacterium]
MKETNTKQAYSSPLLEVIEIETEEVMVNSPNSETVDIDKDTIFGEEDAVGGRSAEYRRPWNGGR